MNYKELLQNVYTNGKIKNAQRMDEKGNWVNVENSSISVFGSTFHHNMSEGFPLTSMRKMPIKSMLVELEGFIKGITSKKWYQERGCKFWDHWCNPYELKDLLYNNPLDDQKIIQLQKEIDDLGPLGYSWGWRNFNGKYKPQPKIYTFLDKTIDIKSSNKYLVGQSFEGKYGPYTVISYDGKDNYYNDLYSVKFHNTGYLALRKQKKSIVDLHIVDPYYPTIHGVGALGVYDRFSTIIDNEKIELLKNSWRSMIQRCYNDKIPAFASYGAKNVYVCSRWLVFENFLADIITLKNWDLKLKNWDDYQLDKDIGKYGYYGPNSCSWVSRSENANSTVNNIFFSAVSPDGIVFEERNNLSDFCLSYGLVYDTVLASLYNGGETHNGWKFTRIDKNHHNYIPEGIDQLKKIIETIKQAPYDRRMVCSAWNPSQLNQMALPPCHFCWGVNIIENKLNLWWTQRSVDMIFGLPNNIASYATLLLLLCEESGFQPGELIGFLVDCHIYTNLFEPTRQFLLREERPCPRLRIKRKEDNSFSLFDWEYKDVELIDYNPSDAFTFGAITV